MVMPNVSSYGNYSNGNYGLHCLRFTDAKGDKYWFSYETLVAFCVNGEFHILKNYWGTTTGKHLNWIDDNKDIREDAETFEENLARLTNKEVGVEI